MEETTWTNYETRNVAMWLTSNAEGYELCKHHRDRGNYYADVAVELAKKGITHTPDGVLFWSPAIDTEALDTMLYELP